MDEVATGLVYVLAGSAALLIPALYQLRQRIDRLEERLAETEPPVTPGTGLSAHNP
jgi:hypothetical protein